MRCISFARLNYLIKFSFVCQPQSQNFFFDRPKPPPIAEFDVLFASGADRALTHKSKKAPSVPCLVGIFPSFTNHATTCFTVNCSHPLGFCRHLPQMPQRRHHPIRKKLFLSSHQVLSTLNLLLAQNIEISTKLAPNTSLTILVGSRG